MKKLILAALLLIVCAGLVRLLTYDRYLPFNDYSDEAVYVSLADEIRGFSDQTAVREIYGQLAPLYVGFNVAVQTVHDWIKPSPWHIPGDYVYSLRITSALFGIGTALAIAWIGWQLNGFGAALIGGMIWALSPIIVNFNSLAIPDPMLYFVCAIAVAAAISAYKRDSIGYLALSLLAGVAAIYIKLWIAAAVVPFVIASFLMVLRDRSRLGKIALLYGVAVLFAAHFLLVVNPFGQTVKVADYLSSGEIIRNLFKPERMLNNLWHIAFTVDEGIGIAPLIAVLGVIAFFYNRRTGSKNVSLSGLAITVIYFLIMWWLSAGISFVNIDSAGRMRHIYPVVVAFLALWAVGLSQLVQAIAHLMKNSRLNGVRIAWSGAAALMLSIGVIFVQQDITLIHIYSRPHSTTQVTQWFDGSPPNEGIVMMFDASHFNTLWNRLWGYYLGSKSYEWWLIQFDELAQSTPEEYVERNIRWFVVSENDLSTRDIPNVDEIRAYLSTLLLVKTIDPPWEDAQGGTFRIYRFEHPDLPVEADFGGQIRLIGLDMDAPSGEIPPGTLLHIRPYWQIDQPITQNYTMFVHLYSTAAESAGTPEVLTQWDGEPITNGNRPTSLWTDTREVYFGEPFAFTLPAELPPGEYVIVIGLYNTVTGERLTNADGSTYFRIPLSLGGS